MNLSSAQLTMSGTLPVIFWSFWKAEIRKKRLLMLLRFSLQRRQATPSEAQDWRPWPPFWSHPSHVTAFDENSVSDWRNTFILKRWNTRHQRSRSDKKHLFKLSAFNFRKNFRAKNGSAATAPRSSCSNILLLCNIKKNEPAIGMNGRNINVFLLYHQLAEKLRANGSEVSRQNHIIVFGNSFGIPKKIGYGGTCSRCWCQVNTIKKLKSVRHKDETDFYQ